jgi:phage shock protein PspC (stress-responsive transcriptional regulator)
MEDAQAGAMTENTDTTHPTETVPVAPGSTRPPLRRSSSDRVLAGVAAGFARWLGIDPVIVRVILVVLAVFGGSGLALYAIGWLFIPEDGSTESQAERFIAKGERPGSSMRTALIVTAAVLGTITILSLLASSNDLWVAGGGGSVLLLLAVGGLVLWLVTRDKPATPRAVATTMVPAAMPPDATVGAAPTSTTPEAGADVPAEFITAAAATQVMPELPAGFAYGGAGQYPGYVAPTPVPVPPAPRRPRSYLG